MPADKKGLSGPTQLLLAALALLPLWYMAAGELWGSSSPDEISPYYMWCPECDLRYYCGPQGAPGMRCPRCARADAALLFRTSTGTDVWDFVFKLFIGIVAFLAVVVLIVGGHQPKKALQPTVVPKSPEEKQAAVGEIKDWARDLIENRRRRLEG